MTPLSEQQHPDGPESTGNGNTGPEDPGTESTASAFRRWMAREAREQAPRPFAVVYEIGDREDCEVAAYGLAFPDRAETTAVDDGHHTRSGSVEHALALYARFAAAENLRAHLVWLDGDTGGGTVAHDLATSPRNA
ncbi:hypothetical protein Amir_5996 [Actinosynnema mirum DSM 43827]|uniref:Uncharacterized protein n=2 Tax=Actinosynnema TaxID=40566 RepID=C6WG39_ACTMD|nr:hypothetical protein Amir_5996 [Actinosynnema mirum DSM 43827]